MTYRKLLPTVFAVCFFLAATITWNVAKAQEEMTEDEAVQKIQQLESKSNELKRQSSALDAQFVEKNNLLKKKQADYEKCIDDLYALVGATRQDIDAYEARLKKMENKIGDLLRLSPMDLLARKGEVDEAEKEYNSLAQNKISLLPAFYDRVRKAGVDIKTLRDTLSRAEKTYVVGTWAKDRDCLWNIAKKPDIYGDAFRWPKIWQKNRDQIKNPDLIYQGQVLKIPAPAPLNLDEESAARKYYRKKREAAAAGSTDTPAPSDNTNK